MPSMELKSISGKGIKSLALFQKPSLYTVITLTNVNQTTVKKSKKKTSVDRNNGENPVWDQPIRIDIDSGLHQDLILEFDLKAEALLGDRVVGRAFIPLADLDFSGAVQHVSYQVKTPEGKANGAINFSYKFDGPEAAVSPPIVPSPPASFAPSAPPVSSYPPQPEAASGYYPTVDPVVAYPPPGTAAAGTYPPPPPPPPSSAGSYPPLLPDGGYPPQPEYCCREIPHPAPNVGGYCPPPAYPPQPHPALNVSGYSAPPAYPPQPHPAPNVGGYYPPPAYPPPAYPPQPHPAPNVGGYYPPPAYPPQPHPAPNVGGYYPPPAYPPQPECCCPENPQPAPAWYYPSGQQPAPGSYYPPPPPPADVYGYRQQGWERGLHGYN